MTNLEALEALESEALRQFKANIAAHRAGKTAIADRVRLSATIAGRTVEAHARRAASRSYFAPFVSWKLDGKRVSRDALAAAMA